MKATLILIGALLCTSTLAMAETRSFSTISPLVPNYNYYGGGFATPGTVAVPAQAAVPANQLVNQPAISYNVLSNMEMALFNRTYRDVPINRISRMENRIFGYVQQGDIMQRYLTLQAAVNEYNSSQYSNNQYQNNQQNFYNTPASSQTGWKGVLSSIGGMFLGNAVGMPTGYSPQLDPYAMNNGGLGTLGGYGSGSGYTVDKGIFGNGYNNSNSTGGMGTGVHIMY